MVDIIMFQLRTTDPKVLQQLVSQDQEQLLRSCYDVVNGTECAGIPQQHARLKLMHFMYDTTQTAK